MGALRNICYDVYNTASLVLCEQREITVSIGVIHRASHHTSILERGETSMASNSLDRRRGGAGLRGGPTRSSPWSHPHLRARSGWACLAPCPHGPAVPDPGATRQSSGLSTLLWKRVRPSQGKSKLDAPLLAYSVQPAQQIKAAAEDLEKC